MIIQKGVSGIVLHSAEIGAVLNDGRAAIFAADFMWVGGRSCHDGEAPASGFSIPFSVGPTPSSDCAGIVGDRVVGDM